MRKVAVIAAALALALPAQAQQASISGCFAETAVQGTFLAQGDRQATGSLGVGCDAKLGIILAGASVRGFAGDVKGGSAQTRLGLAINPHLFGYALAEWRVKDLKIRDVGQLYLGAGVETSVLFNGVSAFVEGATAVSKFGPLATRDDVSTTVGLRYRF